MKFTLEITLGNDAVQTGGDVEEIIRTQLEEIGYYGKPPVISRLIRDLNGATVGHWEFREDDEPGEADLAAVKRDQDAMLIGMMEDKE